MNAHKRTIVLILVGIACFAVAILGALSLYGSLTRIDNPPVLVDGRSYPNSDVAAIMILIGDGISGIALLPHAPVTAIPALTSLSHGVLFNPTLMTLAVTAFAAAGAILTCCILVSEIREKPAGLVSPGMR